MEKVFDRLVEAAKTADAYTGFKIEVIPAGIRIAYTFIGELDDSKLYTIENTTSWGAITQSKINPLLLAMNDLLRQATELQG